MKLRSIVIIFSAVLVVNAHKPSKPKPRCTNDSCYVPGEIKCAKMGERIVTVRCNNGCWELV
jgi:hypothetical protein